MGCKNCVDCMYCTDLHDRQYMILNVQLTKEEYEAWVKKN
jgi:hypothetical protein